MANDHRAREALNTALTPPATATEDRSAEAGGAIYRMVVEWWHEFHDAMPSTAKADHAVRMQQEGIASWGQLRRAGFPIPDFAMAEAKSDPNHPRIMEEIKALGERLKANEAPKGNLSRRAA